MKSSVFLMVCIIMCLSYAKAAEETKSEWTICIHPYNSSTVLYKSFSPLAELLTKKTGHPFRVRIATDYQEHIDLVGADKFGIAYLGPASYVKVTANYGKKRILARQAVNGQPVFQGKIIVRKDSTIAKLKDLRGKRFAFGDPNSTMSHLVPRYMLIEAGVTARDLASYKFLGNHTNVALGVLSGDFDAGAVKEAVFYKYEQRGLKAIATTPPLSEHLFVVNNTVSEAVFNQLKEVFLHLHESEEGWRAIHAIKPTISAFVPAQDSDYDNLRAILAKLKSNGVTQ